MSGAWNARSTIGASSAHHSRSSMSISVTVPDPNRDFQLFYALLPDFMSSLEGGDQFLGCRQAPCLGDQLEQLVSVDPLQVHHHPPEPAGGELDLQHIGPSG